MLRPSPLEPTNKVQQCGQSFAYRNRIPDFDALQSRLFSNCIGGRLTSPERADEFIRAIEALKVLLKPVGSGKPPTGREGLEDILREEEPN
jgi:hypothetical protein